MCETNAALQNGGGDGWQWMPGLYGRDAVMAIRREAIHERVPSARRPGAGGSGRGLALARRDHRLHPVPRRRVGEGLLDAIEGEARGDEALDAELRHEGQRATEGGAAAEGPVEAHLAEVHVPQIEGQRAPLGADADELDDARGPDQGQRLGDQRGLAHGLADDVGPAAARELHHALAETLARGVDDHGRAETPGHRPPLLDGVGEPEPPGAPAAGEDHGEEPHDAAPDHQHARVARHAVHLEPRQAARGRLRHRRGDGIEAAGQGMERRHRQGHALGEATDARAARALRDPALLALGALAAAVGRLARHRASHEATADAPPDTLHDARVLVAQHQGRGPREEPLRRVDVGAADPGGVDGHERLARAGDGFGRLVDGEAATAAPGRDLHARSGRRIARLAARWPAHGAVRLPAKNFAGFIVACGSHRRWVWEPARGSSDMELGDVLLLALMALLMALGLLYESPRARGKEGLITLLILAAIIVVTVLPGMIRRLLR